MKSKIQYTSNNNTGEIILDHPNSTLDLETLTELIAAFKKSAENRDRCALFKARGKNFTVGADLKFIHQLLEDNDIQQFEKFSRAFQDLTIVMTNHPGIIIAGLHGWVVGGGFEISLSADIRYAATNTKIILPELSIGTMFSNASTKLLAQIIGLGRAKEMMLLGDEIDAKRAYDIGLISKICGLDDLDDELNSIASKIVENKDPLAVERAKQLMHMNQDLPIETVLDNELRVLDELSLRDEFKSKINEFMKK